jgi:hypothetical protein
MIFLAIALYVAMVFVKKLYYHPNYNGSLRKYKTAGEYSDRKKSNNID